MFVWYSFFMKKGDLILLLLLIIPAVFFLIYFNSRDIGGEVTVYVDGTSVGTYDLANDCNVTIQGLNNIVNTMTISNGRACISNANCPDHICENSGYICRDKESVCCAPGGILIVISSGEKAEYDAISR